MIPTPPPPPEENGQQSAARARFLREAAPIIAAERGVNASSRIKLAALAHRRGLSEEEFEEALLSLQGEARPASEFHARAEAYQRWLRERLSEWPRDIITAEDEQSLLDAATDRFKLPPDVARECIADGAAAASLRRVSPEEARRYLESLVEQRVGDSAWIENETRDRLRSAGVTWGVEIEQVDELIGQRTRENRRRQVRERQVAALLMGAAALVLAAVIGGLGWMILRDSSGDPTAGGGTAATSTTPASPQPPPMPSEPQWWTVELTIAVGKARARDESLEPLVRGARSRDAAERAETYRTLADAATSAQDDNQRAALETAMLELFAHDPDEEAADALPRRLLELTGLTQDALPKDSAAYDRAFRSMQLIARLFGAPGASSDRPARLSDLLAKTIGVAVSANDSPPAREQTLFAALAGDLYRQLIEHAAEDPTWAGHLQAALATRAADHLSATRLAALQSEFYLALLPALGADWREHEAWLTGAIETAEPVRLLEFIEAYETVENDSLQRWLGDSLLVRLDVEPPSDEPAEIAYALRSAIDSPDAIETSHRWRLLQTRVARALPRLEQSQTDPEAVLRQTVQAAWLADLALALAQGETGGAVFDELVAEGPPQLDPETEPADEERDDDDDFGRRSRSLNEDERRQWVRAGAKLAEFEKLELTERIETVRRLSRLADRAEPNPRQASMLAAYLLAPKDAEEHEKVIRAAGGLLRNQGVRLALADRLPEAKVNQAMAGSLVGRAVSTSIDSSPAETPSDGDAWRERLRAVLLRDLVRELPSGASKREGDFDAHAQQLLGLYQTRAKLLNTPAAADAESDAPGAALRRLVESYAARLGEGDLASRDATFLENLPHRLAAADYRAETDIQRAVLQQRLLHRLAAIEVKQRRPAGAKEAEALLAEAQQTDLETDSLLQQLHAGEIVLLQLWMLHADG